jgi:hypothetical protein
MQAPSRRQVCAGTALAGVSWALGACAPTDEPPVGKSNRLPEPPHGPTPLNLSDFRQMIGSAIDVDVDGGLRSLAVTAVHDHGPPIRRPLPRGEAFTLILDPGPTASSPIASATYQARHSEMGSFTLFLVPHADPRSDRVRYCATFSRI